MVVLSFQKQKELREARNQRLVEAVHNGEDFPAMNVWASWYPERPLIKKDESAIKRLYGESKDGQKPNHSS